MVAIILGLGVVTLDLLTKWVVKSTYWLSYYPVIDGFFRIQHVRNEGIAFGLLHRLDSDWKPMILSAIAVIAVLMVIYYILRTPEEDTIVFIALGLLLGGILGNFIDRLVHNSVFDFLTLHWGSQFTWPTFNVADAAISSGVFLLVLHSLFAHRRKVMVALVWVVPALFLQTSTDASDDLVSMLQHKYQGISSLSASFEQTFTSRGISSRESGIVLMKRPGLMYWEYRSPTRKFFVADGRKTYFYVPKDRQVLVSELNLEDSNSPLLFLFGKGDIRRDFDVDRDVEQDDTVNVVLKLTPKHPNPEFSYVLLEFDPQSLLIHRLTVVEPIGQQNEYLLTDIRQNVKIPDQKFKLRLPSDVEVIEQ